MKKSETEELNKIYHHWYVFDETASEKVGWSEDEDQIGRFTQFLKLKELTGKALIGSSMLDVGCGDAALLAFLYDRLKTKDFHYVGIDINKEYIKRAKELFPEGEFILDDFKKHAFKEFDFCVASGTFNVNVFKDTERAYEVLFESVKKMWGLAKYGIAFNFLSNKTCKEFVLTSDMVVYDKNRILEWCKKLSKNVQLLEGYDEMDSTILMQK